MPNQELESKVIRESLEISESEHEFLTASFPQIANLIKFAGTTGEYYSNVAVKVNRDRYLHKERICNIAEAIKQIGQDIFDEQDLSLISKALVEKPIVSTAEHHSPLTNLLNPAINQAYLRSLLNQSVCITLSCSTVKLDDPTEPRKIFYKDKAIPLLSNKHVKSIILKTPPFDTKSIEIFFQTSALQEEERDTFITDWWVNKMRQQQTFSNLWKQTSYFNYHYWQDIFSETAGFKMPSKYFMIPLEELVRMCLLNDLKNKETNWILSILSCPKLSKRMLKALDGVDACWDIQHGKGSFLFWAIKNNKRTPLYLFNHSLRSKCGSFNYSLAPLPLQENLDCLNIIPTASLSLIYLCLYAGIDLLGGPFQINYLSKIQEKLSYEFIDIIDDMDLNILTQTCTNFYVNFNKTHPAVTGGLHRLSSQITESQVTSLFSQRFCDSTKGSIRRILSKYYKASAFDDSNQSDVKSENTGNWCVQRKLVGTS